MDFAEMSINEIREGKNLASKICLKTRPAGPKNQNHCPSYMMKQVRILQYLSVNVTRSLWQSQVPIIVPCGSFPVQEKDIVSQSNQDILLQHGLYNPLIWSAKFRKFWLLEIFKKYVMCSLTMHVILNFNMFPSISYRFQDKCKSMGFFKFSENLEFFLNFLIFSKYLKILNFPKNISKVFQ